MVYLKPINTLYQRTKYVMELLKQIALEQIGGTPKHSPQLVDLTLQEVVNAGKVTNPYQLFVLGKMAMFFKNGLKSTDLHLENPVNFESGETSTALKTALQAMSDEDHVALAQYLLDCIKAGECMLHDPVMTAEEWMRFVIHKQD